jgi:hypothetical protein
MSVSSGLGRSGDVVGLLRARSPPELIDIMKNHTGTFHSGGWPFFFCQSDGAKIPAMINTFWIAANIIFDLATGEKKDILTLVNHEIDATFFKQADAVNYKSFVELRASNLKWSVDPTNLRGRGDLFVIRGVQNV